MQSFKNHTFGGKSVQLKKGSSPDAIRCRIRLKKEDSAFAYAVFEAQDGVMAYSTLDHQPGDYYRDLELIIPLGMKAEAERILKDLKEELKGELYVEGVDFPS